MFGIFYLFTSTVLGGVAKAKENLNNSEARERARKNNDLTYYGHNGERLVSTDKEVYRKYINGDKVLADLYTGQIYKNFSEEERRKKEHQAEDKGKTVIDLTYTELQEYNKSTKQKVKTTFVHPSYRDIKTRDYYLRVTINGLWFYMNILNGKLVRLVDEEKMEHKYGTLTVEEIINIFNNRQEKIIKEERSGIWLESNFYLQNMGSNKVVIDNDGNIIFGNLHNKQFKELIKALREG